MGDNGRNGVTGDRLAEEIVEEFEKLCAIPHGSGNE
ncbi:MAG: aminoacyl-histidine dipeptidase [Clostridiales bacterium]|nr:aminoacyl-histidine dipeptidase [Clostridiales bacterium]